MCVDLIYVIPAKAGIQIVNRGERRKLRCFASTNKLGSSFRWNDRAEKALS